MIFQGVKINAEVKKDRHAVEYETAERCWIKETANDDGDAIVSIARARVTPGMTTAWHKLAQVTERYIIISGRGRVQVGQADPADVEAGDVVRIPADTPQRIENCGEDDLVFYAVCSPRFRQACYISLE